ncbi:MAG: glycosyltransferase family 61 protein [Myxococcales bacterium FL481]|nr:MAG: glycosyltransferase family 61 protein [Myxococcales bacterium FL481]
MARLHYAPIWQMVRSKLLRRDVQPLRAVAERSWEIAPRHAAPRARAVYLPGQLERVTGCPFQTWHPRREMESGEVVEHDPTVAHLIRDAVLLDGAVYKGWAADHLHPRLRSRFDVRIDQEVDRGALFCSQPGNKWFGNWLMDDCPTYLLAAEEGQPVATAQPEEPHTAAYERRLGMSPQRHAATLFRELVVFDDRTQNRSKHGRCREIRAKLLGPHEPSQHAGVFILRGRSGARRVLVNEMELAERLRERRGFRVIDPMQLEVDQIIAACAGARVVVGVEGSGLIHGLQLLDRGGALVALQPPHRFVCVYKDLTDRDDQIFAFVVGSREGEDFRIDPEELERTLDLLPKPT